MATQSAIGREYPCTVRLNDKIEVTLRLMDADDVGRIVAFGRSQPQEDLLFLRIDITDPEAVTQWAQRQAAGQSLTLIAQQHGEMIGYGSLVHNEITWQRHLGEIRLVVDRRHRGQGLGRALAGEIFQIARNLGLRKMVAQMTPDQKGAIATFEHLGFQPEALLQDFVIDRGGTTHDMVVMSYDVDGLTDRVD
jgi:L-amino acid N-acyltransferase YncA